MGQRGDRAGSRCRAAIDQIEQVPQRQDSLEDQLHDMARAANRLGCYDAADWIRQNFKRPPCDDCGERPRSGDSVFCVGCMISGSAGR
jgi:hypothetical protein